MVAPDLALAPTTLPLPRVLFKPGTYDSTAHDHHLLRVQALGMKCRRHSPSILD